MIGRNALLAMLLVLLMLAGCGASEQQTAKATVSKGEPFQAGGEAYMLSEIVHVTEYDTGEKLGYGVIVMMKSASAPVSFSADGGSVKSLIDLTLDDGSGGVYQSTNIAFAANDDSSGYLGYARFEFSLPKGAAFPQTGTFQYTDDSAEKYAVSFAGMEITRTIAGEDTEKPAEDPPEQAQRWGEGEELISSFAEFRVFVQDEDTYAMKNT